METHFRSLSIADVEETNIVDPTKAMNIPGAAGANLPDGATVTDGSFTINGETITVNAADSINDVLGRITASDANVTATWNAANETVELEQKTNGSASTITLSGDTSGFLDAMKLSGATVVAGEDGDDEKTLNQVDDFSGVQTGTFYINGTAISVNPATDSFVDVVNRIDAASAGIVTSDADGDTRIELSSVNGTETVELSDNGTGFLTALGFADGVHDILNVVTTQHPGSLRGVSTNDAAQSISRLVRTLEGAMTTSRSTTAGRLFRSSLESAATEVTGSVKDGERLLKTFGFDLDSGSTSVTFDRVGLKRGLRGNQKQFIELMNGRGTHKGFLESLEETLKDDLDRLRYQAAASGEYLY